MAWYTVTIPNNPYAGPGGSFDGAAMGEREARRAAKTMASDISRKNWKLGLPSGRAKVFKGDSRPAGAIDLTTYPPGQEPTSRVTFTAEDRELAEEFGLGDLLTEE